VYFFIFCQAVGKEEAKKKEEGKKHCYVVRRI